MADTYIQGSFAFRCTNDEADLLAEAIAALNQIDFGAEPEPPSPAMASCLPPIREGAPWSGLLDRLPDPEFPRISADFLREDVPGESGGALVCFSSTHDLDPAALAELIRGCCGKTLALKPIGFEWAKTCSRPRDGAFGGGSCAIFVDEIIFDSTNAAMIRALGSRQIGGDGDDGEDGGG